MRYVVSHKLRLLGLCYLRDYISKECKPFSIYILREEADGCQEEWVVDLLKGKPIFKAIQFVGELPSIPELTAQGKMFARIMKTTPLILCCNWNTYVK